MAVTGAVGRTDFEVGATDFGGGTSDVVVTFCCCCCCSLDVGTSVWDASWVASSNFTPCGRGWGGAATSGLWVEVEEGEGSTAAEEVDALDECTEAGAAPSLVVGGRRPDAPLCQKHTNIDKID